MSGPILFGENLVTLPSARIARRDVAALQEADALLAEAKRIRDEAAAQSEAARAEGYADGQQAARDELATVLGDTLQTLAEGFAKENERRAQHVSEAAMEVVTQLIGRRETPEIVTGLAARTLSTLGAGDSECIIELSPDMVDPVRERLPHLVRDTREVRIEANETLGTLGCRVLSGEGVIVADLDTQLQTLRQRWGLDQRPETAPDSDGAG
ncbi:MAG: FliH/SctL family protein [Erythrobacter sp.]